MNLNSPLFDKIRTKPQAEDVRADEGPKCEHPGCQRKGEFRAPKGRDFEGQFFRFCLEHVKEYNASYNYFAGMSDGALRDYQKDAVTGHRPTWNVGVGMAAGLGPDTKLDAATLLRARLERLRRAREAAGVQTRKHLPKLAIKALETLGLEPGVEKAAVRARFKELAKRLHPDLNEGDRSREDKLRAIIDAYNYLKSVDLA
ncbi:MAG: J domain-containing protein [Proteobacteria bacterium]|nr:J domain-containing protein [Pseudomonadota bacterium]